MDVVELLSSVHLTDVRTIQTMGELKLDPSGKGLAELDESKRDGELSIAINPVAWGRHIEVWFRAQFETSNALLVAAVAVTYERESEAEIPDETQTEFIEKVAVMAAYPYLRSMLQGLAAEMRFGTLTLDVLRQGEFQMTPLEADNAAE
ncbi:MAG: hypothetical protein R2722_14655 [Tessaracoccus sp.]